MMSTRGRSGAFGSVGVRYTGSFAKCKDLVLAYCNPPRHIVRMPALRRLAGAALLVTAYAPLHRLLDVERTGPAGAATRAAAEGAWMLGLSGTVIVLAFSWVFTRMVPPAPGEGRLAAAGARLSGPPAVAFAAGVGALALVLGAAVALGVHGAHPGSVDEMAQLLHARAVAAGRLTIPLEGPAAAWIVQNGVVTDGGWASIYPPLHTLLLAAGMALGAPWLVGPLAIGSATALVTLSAERLVGAVTGRVAGLLLALSPFWLLLGSTYASHATAAAGLAFVLWTSLRARGGAAGWAVAVGAAVGLAVTARPWTGLACGGAIVAALLGRDLFVASAGAVRRASLLAAGGAPFALLLLGWNRALFGHPLRLGYTEAFGDAHGLGLHVDPWGNRYGAVEAVAYTGADLVQLGVRLLESPLPAVAILGVALLARPLRSGAGVFAAWAAAGVGANALYWHHGIHLGPRMLFETAPAWVVLLVTAVAPLFAAEPAAVDAPPRQGLRFARWSVVFTIAGGIALAPSALLATARARASVAAPAPPETPAVVFAHGSWASRVSARLAATGMRRDSIETALRRNDVCAVDRYARWRSGAAEAPAPSLDFEPRPGTPPHLVPRRLSPANLVRVDPAAPHDVACAREARSDRLGAVELELLAWRLPPVHGARVRVARDLGPAANLRTLQAVGGVAYVLVDREEGGPILLEYDEGMELLWGGAASEATRE